MVRCDHCGEEIGLLAVRYTWLDKEKRIAVHDKCLKEYERKKSEGLLKTPEKIDLQEKQQVEEKFIEDDEKIKKKIRWGWMGVFIIILVAISPLFSIFVIYTSWGDAISYGLFDLYPKFYLVSIVDIVVSILLIIFSIYAGLSLYFFKDRAVFKAKLFLIVGLIYAIIAPFSIYFVDFPQDALSYASGDIGTGIFRSLIFFGVWYWFLTSSKSVLEYNIYIDSKKNAI